MENAKISDYALLSHQRILVQNVLKFSEMFKNSFNT